MAVIAGQRVETFTQKMFMFYDAESRLTGVRSVGRLAGAIEAWLKNSGVVLRGMSPLLVVEPSLAAPARVRQWQRQMIDTATGETGTLPPGFDDATTRVEEHSTVVTVFGDIVPAGQGQPVQRVALFSQLDYTFFDSISGKTLATRSLGRIAAAIEAWAEANGIRIMGMGQMWIRNPPVEVSYANIDQSRLVNPRTRQVEPYVGEPGTVRVMEFMTTLPVYGEVVEEGKDDSSQGRGQAGAAIDAVRVAVAPAEDAGDRQGVPVAGS